MPAVVTGMAVENVEDLREVLARGPGPEFNLRGRIGLDELGQVIFEPIDYDGYTIRVEKRKSSSGVGYAYATKITRDR